MADLLQDRSDVRECCVPRDTGLQLREHRRHQELRRRQDERRPVVCTGVRIEVEAARKDTEDRHASPIELQRPPDHVRRAIEVALPRGVAQENDATGCLVPIVEEPSQLRLRAQHREKRR